MPQSFAISTSPAPPATSVRITGRKPTSSLGQSRRLSAAPEPVTVFGTDYETRDGTAIRDYVHVDDLIDAHLRALDLLRQASETLEPINLGTRDGASVLEVLDAIEAVTGTSVPRTSGRRRPGIPPRSSPIPRRAAEILGWQPPRSSLDEIVESAWEWRRRFPDGLPGPSAAWLRSSTRSPRRRSVPCRSRRILSPWRKTMIAGDGAPCRTRPTNQTCPVMAADMANAVASTRAISDPRDTRRVSQIDRQTTGTTKQPVERVPVAAPAPVATPFPPLNWMKGDQQWPATVATAAAACHQGSNPEAFATRTGQNP